ncbi:MAG: MFS transporter [Cyanobacteria bacterium J06632_22]
MDNPTRLSLTTKLAYGAGEIGLVMPVSIAIFFLLYFLTDVAGLNPTLAGTVLLIGTVWDAISDPLIGWLSDRTRSRWGRRFPWMVGGGIPLVLCCTLQWWVPPFASQQHLFVYYGVLSIVVYASYTAVMLPFTALAAELASDYDERTAMMGFKSGFNTVGSILALVVAQVVFTVVADPRQQYLTIGVLTSVGVFVGIALCIWGTQRRYWLQQKRGISTVPLPTQSFRADLLSVLANRPFRWLLGLYLGAWIGTQVAAAMLPYFISSWMQLPERAFTQMAIAIQGMAVVSLPIWMAVTRATGKRTTFFLGAPLTLLALLGLITVQPGQVSLMYGLAAFSGVGLATFYLVPFAMLPDVIDLDAARTGWRQEGLFFSCLVFCQKLGSAIALFMIGVLLDQARFGANSSAVEQPVSALWTIRLLISVVPAVLIALSLYFAYHYPLRRVTIAPTKKA